MKFSVAQIGPYPLPIGGVSMHVKRLHRRLLADGHQSVVFSQPGWKGDDQGVTPRWNAWRFERELWLLRQGLWTSAEIVHCHDMFIWSSVLWPLVKLGKRVVMTVHNEMCVGADPIPTGILGRFAQKMLRCENVSWIAVNSRIEQHLIDYGVSPFKVRVIPAFIAPSEDELKGLPDHVERFIASHCPVLAIYGYRSYFDRDGLDMYGFDMALELTRRLKARYPQVGLLWGVSEPQEPLFKALQNSLDGFRINDNVLLMTGELPDGPSIWRRCDVYLRPSSTDGDAVSVREALALGTPVVASDAVARPSAAFLFKNRDADDFTRVVSDVLDKKTGFTINGPQTGLCNYSRVLETYDFMTKTYTDGFHAQNAEHENNE